MDVSMVSTALRNHNQTQDGASLMVLKKAMDSTEQNAASMVNMLAAVSPKTMESSVNSHLGSNIDIKL